MILTQVLRDVFGSKPSPEPPAARPASATPSVLNVGGNSKAIPIPEHYNGWNHVLLDIDAAGRPDIVCDARNLPSLGADRFDAVYCSHNLEHYYPHDGVRVLRGFHVVLKPHGFAEIRVPDLSCVWEHVVANRMDIEDVLYESPSGPITVRDVLYGWGKQIETSGVDFFAHKTGFTPKSLAAALAATGFETVLLDERKHAFEVSALAFKTVPTAEQTRVFGL